MLKLTIGIMGVFFCAHIMSVESSFKGLLDIRAVSTNGFDNSQSYLEGDYGKFRFSDGNQIALGQLGLHYHAEWQHDWSFNLVGNGFSDGFNTSLGITEAYVQYKALPTASGWRMQAKAGVYYPQISLENIATAWSSPYTLSSSTINNWIGEELRNTGFNIKMEKLGKTSRSPHSFSIEFDVFQNNDTAGAMLAWHGWTVGSRQTLLNEKLILQDFPARNGMLSEQAWNSDPILELDNRWGFNIKGEWRYNNNLRINLGYYDNQAKKGLVENGQYTWTTYFVHAGIKYKLAKSWELIGQIMQGNTLMKSPTLIDVVNNDFSSAYLMLRKNWGNHHVALRLEQFSVDDLDNIQGDNNNESGNAMALAYRYKLNRQSFILAEYTLVDSSRGARMYEYQPIDLTEHQYQIAYRYYF